MRTAALLILAITAAVFAGAAAAANPLIPQRVGGSFKASPKLVAVFQHRHLSGSAASVSRIGQSNAARAAQNYVQTMPFSYKSLVEQLQYDGYSRGDAIYGASRSGANWMQQAVLSARNYLETMPFSYSDLVGQLKYDGFTPAQARHGASVAYR